MEHVINVHPMFVHFPVALFTLYAVAESVRLRKVQDQPFWFYGKAVLIILGALSGIPTLMAGELAEQRFEGKPEMRYIEVHSAFAGITEALALVLAAVYAIVWLKQSGVIDKALHSQLLLRIWNYTVRIAQFFMKSWIIVPLAILLFVLISVTAALGGGIEYGPANDPVTKIIFKLFFGV